MHGSLYIRRACPTSTVSRLPVIHSYRCHPSQQLRSIATNNRRIDPTTTTFQRLASTPSRRLKSTWGRPTLSHSWRGRTLWHRPGCKWVRSEAAADAAEPDKDCSACQEKRDMPYELSDRELRWQKHYDHIKSIIETDAYHFLFGASNDRLRGIFPRSTLFGTQSSKPAESKPETSTTETMHSALKKEWEPRPSHSEKTTASSVHKIQVNGTGAESQSSQFPPAKFETQGEWQFDPISMRMVFKSRETLRSPSPNDAKRSMVTQHAGQPLSIIAKSATVGLHVNKASRKPIMSPSEYKQWSAARTAAAATPQNSQQSPSRQAQEQPLATGEPAVNTAAARALDQESVKSSSQGVSSAEGADARPAWAKTALERSWALEKGKAPRPIRRAVVLDAETSRAKEALERSWKKENPISEQDRIAGSRIESEREVSAAKSTAINSLDKRSGLIQTWLNIKNAGPVDLAARRALLTKDKPFKHMTYFEFKKHQGALIDAWRKKPESKPLSGADKILEDEVKAQKLAMTAFENKWRLRDEAQTSVSAITNVPEQSGVMKTPTSEAFEKRRATLETQKSQDAALVREIQQIYESSRHLIDPPTKKPESAKKSLDADLMDYEKRAGRNVYCFKPDNLEQQLRDVSKGKDAIVEAATPPTALQEFEKQDAYVFKPDSLEKQLKGFTNVKDEGAVSRAVLGEFEKKDAYIFKPDSLEKQLKDSTTVKHEAAVPPAVLGEFEKKAEPSLYAYKPDKLESELKAPLTNGHETAVDSKILQEFEKKAGPSVYSFKPDDVELEIKTKASAAGESAVGTEVLEEFEKRAGPSVYSFEADDIESKLIPAAAQTAANENALYSAAIDDYEAKAGKDLYAFKPDNVEKELKNSSAGDKLMGLDVTADRLAKDEMVRNGTENIKVAKAISSKAEASTSNIPSPRPKSDRDLYQVLAYDPSDNAIHVAAASSSFTTPTHGEVLALNDALTRLDAPAKFLSHLTKYQNEGYDVVSASRNLLVLKRTRPVSAADVARIFEEVPPSLETSKITTADGNRQNPVDGTSAASLEAAPGNFASPTGFVNHDQVSPLTNSARPARSGRRVRKEESVFSGTSLGASSTAKGNLGDASAATPAASLFGGDKSQNHRDRISAPTAPASQSKDSPVNGSSPTEPSGPSSSPFKRGLVFTGWLMACLYATGAAVEWFRERNEIASHLAANHSGRTRSMSSGSIERRTWASEGEEVSRGFWGMRTVAGEAMMWGVVLAPVVIFLFGR